MVAALARHLHQDILRVEDWEVPVFYRYFAHMNTLLERERPDPDSG